MDHTTLPRRRPEPPSPENRRVSSADRPSPLLRSRVIPRARAPTFPPARPWLGWLNLLRSPPKGRDGGSYGFVRKAGRGRRIPSRTARILFWLRPPRLLLGEQRLKQTGPPSEHGSDGW